MRLDLGRMPCEMTCNSRISSASWVPLLGSLTNPIDSAVRFRNDFDPCAIRLRIPNPRVLDTASGMDRWGIPPDGIRTAGLTADKDGDSRDGFGRPLASHNSSPESQPSASGKSHSQIVS